ncbi:MAG: LysM peptidoglycan-binding domain-containing protein [Lachnospiraceae bacterium]|nr:LysM peptidoglycan-binding domain-containing protein [Lachnospiraceae bacterium]
MMRNSTRGNYNKNNTMNQRRAAAKRNTKKRVSSATKFFITLMVIVAAVCIILFSNKNVTNADESGNAVELTKYYKTITIESGDTLWSIAKEYKSGAYKTTQDYVDELISMNHLHSDAITSGQKLIVAYFQ